MIKNFKKLSILLFTSIFLFSSVKADWITKKVLRLKKQLSKKKKQNLNGLNLKKEIKAN